MARRQALKATVDAAAAAAFISRRQETSTHEVWFDPATGADTNPGTKASPVRAPAKIGAGLFTKPGA